MQRVGQNKNWRKGPYYKIPPFEEIKRHSSNWEKYDHYIFTSTSTKLLPPLWQSLYLHLYLHKTVATIVTIITSLPLPPQNCCHHCDDHYIFTSTSSKLLPPLWRSLYLHLYLHKTVATIVTIIISSPLPPQNCCRHCDDHYNFTSTSTKLLPPLWRSLCLHLYLHKTVATIVTIIISSPLPPQNCCD